MEPRIFKTTKRASFGVTRSGYDADQPANLSQWQKETMGDLLPMEHHGDRVPAPNGISNGRQLAWLAVIFLVAVPAAVGIYWHWIAA